MSFKIQDINSVLVEAEAVFKNLVEAEGEEEINKANTLTVACGRKTKRLRNLLPNDQKKKNDL